MFSCFCLEGVSVAIGNPVFFPRLIFNWRTFLRRVRAHWWRQWEKIQVSTNQNSRNRWCQIVRGTACYMWKTVSLIFFIICASAIEGSFTTIISSYVSICPMTLGFSRKLSSKVPSDRDLSSKTHSAKHLNKKLLCWYLQAFWEESTSFPGLFYLTDFVNVAKIQDIHTQNILLFLFGWIDPFWK